MGLFLVFCSEKSPTNLRSKIIIITIIIIVTVIPFVMGTLGTVPKCLERGLEELKIERRIETIQTIAYRSARIMRRVLDT